MEVLYGGIDLHSNSSVVVVKDAEGLVGIILNNQNLGQDRVPTR